MALAGICKTTRVLQFCKFPRCAVNFLTETKHSHVQFQYLVNNDNCKNFCTQAKKPRAPGKPGDPKSDEKPKTRKPLTSPQITLILPGDEVQAVTLEQAEKLAKRRNLKLVKIVDFDTRSEKPVYKLMTTLEYFQEDTLTKQKRKQEKETAEKDMKLFTISSKIADHDLGSKTRQMFKLLKKRHPVGVFISFDGNPPRAEELAKLIEEELAEVTSSIQNTKKGNSLKLFFKPKLESAATDSGENATSKDKVEKPDTSKSKATAANVEK